MRKVIVGMFLLAGCPDSHDVDEGSQLPVPDSSVTANDSGVSHNKDSGQSLEEDAGTPAKDAGGTPTDAGGTPTDAGGTPTDAGSTPTDAGGTPTDAGVTPTDAGAPVDSGPAPDCTIPNQQSWTASYITVYNTCNDVLVTEPFDPYILTGVTKEQVCGATASDLYLSHRVNPETCVNTLQQVCTYKDGTVHEMVVNFLYNKTTQKLEGNRTDQWTGMVSCTASFTFDATGVPFDDNLNP